MNHLDKKIIHIEGQLSKITTKYYLIAFFDKKDAVKIANYFRNQDYECKVEDDGYGVLLTITMKNDRV
jgi:hypothetical protein